MGLGYSIPYKVHINREQRYQGVNDKQGESMCSTQMKRGT